jgi:hypothetical protein
MTPSGDFAAPAPLDPSDASVLMAQNKPPAFPPAQQAQAVPDKPIPFDDADTNPAQTGYRNLGALKRYPTQVQNLAKGLMNYSLPFPSYQLGREAQKGGGVWTTALQAAMEADPSFDSTQYPARAQLVKKFAALTGADNKTALNTAILHLDSLHENQQKLNNFSSPLLNAPINYLEQHVTGDPRQGNVEASANAVADELTRAFRGTGGSEAEVQAWKNLVGGVNQSPQQQQGVIDNAVKLLSGRLRQLRQQYVDGMGRPPEYKMLAPDSRAILQKLGYDPDAVESGVYGATGGVGTAATVNMKAPDGTVKPVPADQVAHYKSLGAVQVP